MLEDFFMAKRDLGILQKKIAKQIYDEMKTVCDKWENSDIDLDIECHWEGVVSVDDYTFDESDLREEYED